MLERRRKGALEAEYKTADEIEREHNEAAQADSAASQTAETAREAQSEATRRRELLLSESPGAQSHFVFETVFSDPYGHKLAELRRGVTVGYYVVLVFVGLNDVELAQQRVQNRVVASGP